MSESHALITWAAEWLLDGDIVRCRKCGRGIHVSNKLEPLIHSSECERSQCAFPWQHLERLIGPSILEMQLTKSRNMVATIAAELAAAKQRLDEVTKQRDALATAGENLIMATEKIGAPVSSAEWRGYTIASVAMHSAIKAAKGGES